jgi:hypothetical protein
VLDYHYKYALFIVGVSPCQVRAEREYGDVETHTGVERRVRWLDIADLRDLVLGQSRKLRILGTCSHSGRAILRALDAHEKKMCVAGH